MIAKNLGNTDFELVLESFLLAFQDYFVTVPTDGNYYKERWKAAKVDFNFSYGMFDGEKLVGFVIHAIDHRNGKLTAFNTGTGVIPDYRGRKITRSIYEYAFADLKRIGVTNCVLEVIIKNKKAIRSYTGIGFKTYRTYQCFKGIINPKNIETVALTEVELEKVDWANLPNQGFYSWDHQKESILRSNYKFFHVVTDTIPESFFIIHPNTGYLVQFDVLKENKDAWNRLFSGTHRISSTLKVNNVDERLTDKLVQLRAIGLVNTIDQFEMRMEI
ncbi:GNAT family N-acetyltransferase [Ulvibacterium marinum]|uniref:GNAT family N-acetyltransferase n=1 Tax=Ulvibacterium marinum TaxID=2419782 RepID=A0A3B0C505_9FLAO|nr:GNAT family N-acetyltransferase [Ulvibacterium marinum]RKN81395.1 GNAT family N-acetyltransferase [Ulvibacterium marinum]